MGKAQGAEAMQARVDAYYDGRGDRPPTLAGLALALGLRREDLALGRYAGAHKEIVLKAYLRYEEYLEARLHDKDGYRGAEFCLVCNCGWDKQARDDSGDAILRNVREMVEGISRGV